MERRSRVSLCETSGSAGGGRVVGGTRETLGCPAVKNALARATFQPGPERISGNLKNTVEAGGRHDECDSRNSPMASTRSVSRMILGRAATKFAPLFLYAGGRQMRQTMRRPLRSEPPYPTPEHWPPSGTAGEEPSRNSSGQIPWRCAVSVGGEVEAGQQYGPEILCLANGLWVLYPRVE